MKGNKNLFKYDAMNKKEVFGIALVSPQTASPLFQEDNYLISKHDEKFPIINNIPRFVTHENYASAFGLQWNTFKKTQLDSYTGLPLSKDRLKRIVGGSLDIFKNKKVLEAGCGAGRFTEIMLQSGASVFAADISSAVEANYENCSKFQNYFVCQADILKLPVNSQQFDIVVCIGVIQHTPDPEKTIATLCSYLKFGGSLFIDHYSKEYPATLSRKIFRFFLSRMKNENSLKFVQKFTQIIWPLHTFFFNYRSTPGMRIVRGAFLYFSPVVDHHDAYNMLGEKLLYEWAILDTFDTLTDIYKHLRSEEEIAGYLRSNRMEKIEINQGGNGIEVRAVKS